MKRVLIFFCCVILIFSCFSFIPAHAAQDIKIAAFTFDDGPNKSITPKLLDSLASRGVCVTFFVNGKNAETYPEIILRAASEGHQIANHTYSHSFLTKLSDSEIRYEVSRTQDYLCQLLGDNDYLVRVPYGAINDRVQAQIDEPLIFWSVDPTNGKVVPASKMRDGIVSAAHDGAIILMHDTSTANLEASIAAIDILLSEGYVFVTVDQLFELKNIVPVASQKYYKVTNDTVGLFDEADLTSHWAYESISIVEEKKIMVGDDTGFHPNAGITRAEAVTILWRMSGEPYADAYTPFTDISKEQWYSTAVSWAYENDIVHGVSDTRFNPKGKVTKEAFYKMFESWLEYCGLDTPSDESVLDFKDANAIGDWAYGSIAAVMSRGFVSKHCAPRFYPKTGLTRAQAAELAAWSQCIINI